MNMTTNENTTTAQARELARELRENNGSMRTVYNIAATLDALADECERLREERSKWSYMHDHMRWAIGYVLESIDEQSNGEYSAEAKVRIETKHGHHVMDMWHQLCMAERIVETADEHKSEWNSYR